MTRRDWLTAVSLIALCLLCGGWYLLRGAGFVLDDWYFLRNAELDGALRVGGAAAGDRPFGTLVRVVLFGVIGPHPAPILLLMALGNGLTAVLFWRLSARFFPERIAVLAAAVWAILPVHMSLEAWMSASVAVVAQLAATAAILLVADVRPSAWRVVAAAGLCLAAVLSYESSALLAAGGVVVVRRVHHRRLDLRVVAPVLAATSGGLLWAVTHWPDGRGLRQLANPLVVLSANFGRGISPNRPLAVLVLTAVLVGVAVVTGRALRRGSLRSEPAPMAILAGMAVLLAGTTPFLFYFYSPWGAGDRVNWISAFGGALVLSGLAEHLRRLSPVAATGAVTLLLVLAVSARAERTDLWATAGRDGWRVSRAVAAGHPDPGRPILVGPEPIVVDNVAAFVDGSNVQGAVQLAYGTRSVDVDLSYSPRQFARAVGAIRFDQRPFSRLDEASGW